MLAGALRGGVRDQPVDGRRPPPVDTELAVKQWDRLRETLVGLGHRCTCSPPSRACPTWSSPPTARSRSTAASTAPGSSTRSGPPRPPRTGAFYERAGLAVRRAERDQRGRGRLRVPAGGARRADPGRARLPHRARRRTPRRRRRSAGRWCRCAWSTRASTTWTWRWRRIDDDEHRLLPGRVLRRLASGCCAQLFPDAVIADEADALAFGLNLVSDGAQRRAQQRGHRAWPASSRRPATPRCRSSWPS